MRDAGAAYLGHTFGGVWGRRGGVGQHFRGGTGGSGGAASHLSGGSENLQNRPHRDDPVAQRWVADVIHCVTGL